MKLSSIFSHDKKAKKSDPTKNYASVTDFVDEHIGDIKAMLSSVGYNDTHKRLEDLAIMTHCHVINLCQKLPGLDKFAVIDSSDTNSCPKGTVFTWPHSQSAASPDATSALMALPFNIISPSGFISVPIKNSRNTHVGILLGISTDKLSNIDSKTQLLHIIAPLFEAEVRCAKLKQDGRQYEQRIASLNQNIEVMTSDLNIERERSVESKELKLIFLTNLSHEIRTPMNVILGFIDLLDAQGDPKEQKEFINIIKQNGRLLLTVIDNLIEISKLQSSYMFKAACPVQLNELLTRIKMKYEDVLRKMNKEVVIQTTFALDTPNDTIWNSEEIITKTLEQIMNNACHYTQKGKISISYTINHKEATFCVTDTGPGVKPGTEESIFNMFGLNDKDMTHTDGTIGKGIGLAVAKKYISLAGGKIWADPSYKDGACFYFTIPTEKL